MCDFCWGGYRRHSRGAAARPSGPSLPPDPPVPSAPVGPGVLLCWRAPSLPRVRYKILPAWLLGGDNGIKLSLHVEKAPNRAISGELGEFCTGSRPCGSCGASFVPHMRCEGVCWESFVPEVGRPWVLLLGFSRSWALGPGLPGPQVRSTTVAVGVLHYTKPSTGVSPACRTLL